MADRTDVMPMWDQPGVHDIYRRWRKVTDSYAVEGQDADRILCAEAWVLPADSLAKYVRGDELHQCFNFAFLMTPWIASEMRAEITESLAAVASYAAPQTWVLSNHDVVRHAVAARLRPGARTAARSAGSEPTTRSPTRRSACAAPAPRRR